MTTSDATSPEVLDALLELVTIGVGRGAAGLSELTGREVGISVPTLEIFDFEQSHPSDQFQGASLRVRQSFDGGITGHALFVLNVEGAHRVAELLLGGTGNHDAFDDNEQAALLELGNIIIGGVVSQLVNQIGESVNWELPQLQLRGSAGLVDMVSDLADPRGMRVILMRATLSLESENVSGYLMLVLSDEHLSELMEKLEHMLALV